MKKICGNTTLLLKIAYRGTQSAPNSQVPFYIETAIPQFSSGQNEKCYVAKRTNSPVVNACVSASIPRYRSQYRRVSTKLSRGFPKVTTNELYSKMFAAFIYFPRNKYYGGDFLNDLVNFYIKNMA